MSREGKTRRTSFWSTKSSDSKHLRTKEHTPNSSPAASPPVPHSNRLGEHSLHPSHSVPLFSIDKDVSVRKHNSEKSKQKQLPKRKICQSDQSLDSPSISPRGSSRVARNLLRGLTSPRLPERGKKSTISSQVSSPRRNQHTAPDASDPETTPVSDTETLSSSNNEDYYSSSERKKDTPEYLRVVQNKERLFQVKLEKIRRTKEYNSPELTALILLPRRIDMTLPELEHLGSDIYEIFYAAEVAHYKKKYKTAASLFRFLREYTINFHLAHRLAGYYFHGLGGLEKNPTRTQRFISETIETAVESDPLSNYDLANLYESGNGVPKDFGLSLALYMLSAEQNCAKAQYNLGLIHSERGHAYKNESIGDESDSAKKEYELAFKYFKMSAKQDFPGAICNLGVMYQLGEGVKKDYNLAIKYYKRAAKLNYAVAQYNLGLIYETGLGDIPMNLAESVRYFEKASLSKHGGSEFRLAVMYKKGRGVCKDYEISLHYFRKAARHGCVRAYYYIGNMHRKGQGLPKKDKQTALHFYLKATQFHHYKAYNKVGLMYARGSDTLPRDDEKAVEFYKLGADHGSSRAQYNLGVMYERGKGIHRDLEKAFEYFKLSADQGYVKAQYNLGWMYQNGLGVKTDNAKAREYLTKAAEQKSPEALYYLGWMYFHGEGVDAVDKELAMMYWKISAEFGYEKARSNLGDMNEAFEHS
eukprot:TRINITY_DN8232_c0_g1_i1.p1 TRINITY_DN8232_c0_g1~~TRINITY_DN8232_c0_g1_i1.p1  ORF type:complete len:700 (+),score=78.14 TRINITY_DN8232_c0_g1_i1:237-2336(+)